VRDGNIIFRTFDAALLRAGLAVGLVVLGAGCQQEHWYQEGKTFAECKTDYDACWTELLKRTELRHASSYQHRFMVNCMRQRGYELRVEKDLPLDARREDPEVASDVPWYYAYGVAGALQTGPRSLPPDGSPAESLVSAGR
jgi:hypothetical protein